MARFDIADRSGKVIVEKDKRINAKHLRDLANGGIQRISVPEDFLFGRVLANPSVLLMTATSLLMIGAFPQVPETVQRVMVQPAGGGEPVEATVRPES